MRAEIYKAVKTALKSNKNNCNEVQYVGLWNNEIEKIQGNIAFPLPAVFVEFETIEWDQGGLNMRTGDVAIRLHIITAMQMPWVNNETEENRDIEYLELINKINRKIQGLEGDNFSKMMLTTSATNHNHNELVESIERFECRGRDLSSMLKTAPVEIKQTKILKQ